MAAGSEVNHVPKIVFFIVSWEIEAAEMAAGLQLQCHEDSTFYEATKRDF